MDIKTYTSTLLEQSKYLEKISNKLTQRITKLEQALLRQNITTYTEARPLMAGLSNLSMNICDLAAILQKRISMFIEKTNGETPTTS